MPLKFLWVTDVDGNTNSAGSRNLKMGKNWFPCVFVLSVVYIEMQPQFDDIG